MFPLTVGDRPRARLDTPTISMYVITGNGRFSTAVWRSADADRLASAGYPALAASFFLSLRTAKPSSPTRTARPPPAKTLVQMLVSAITSPLLLLRSFLPRAAVPRCRHPVQAPRCPPPAMLPRHLRSSDRRRPSWRGSG